MKEASCNDCDWEGLLIDLVDTDPVEQDEGGNDIMACPDCGSTDIYSVSTITAFVVGLIRLLGGFYTERKTK